jgi:hypothetical protein
MSANFRVVTSLAGAVIGLTVFAALVWGAVTVEQADPSEAAQRFAAIRAAPGGLHHCSTSTMPAA